MFANDLRENLERVIGRRNLAEGETIRISLSRLDEIAAQEDLPERLVHYLSRRSYVKALEWLDNPDIPHQR